MAIKLIINGFYRSGTTYAWSEIKNSVSKETICLYESLHPSLFKLIEMEKRDSSVNILHKKKLWSEYYDRLPSDIYIALKKTLPEKSIEFGCSSLQILRYFDIINSINEDTIIQINRGHRHIELLSKHLNSPAIHILRDPVEVFNSLKGAYLTQNSFNFFIYLYRKSRAILGKENPFGISSLYNNIFSRNSFKKIDLHGKFISIWSILNYEAISQIRNIDKGRGCIVNYKDLHRFKNIAESLCPNIVFLDNIDNEPFKPTSRGEVTSSNCTQSIFEKWVRELDIVEEYETCLNALNGNFK